MPAFRRLFRHRCTIQRNTTSVSATGASKFSYANIATNVPCLLVDRGNRMTQGESGIAFRQEKRAMFGAEVVDFDLQEGDLVIEELTSKVYLLVHINPVRGMGGIVHHVECNLTADLNSGGHEH